MLIFGVYWCDDSAVWVGKAHWQKRRLPNFWDGMAIWHSRQMQVPIVPFLDTMQFMSMICWPNWDTFADPMSKPLRAAGNFPTWSTYRCLVSWHRELMNVWHETSASLQLSHSVIGSMGLVYFLTLTIKSESNVGKCTIPGSYGFGVSFFRSKNLCIFWKQPWFGSRHLPLRPSAHAEDDKDALLGWFRHVDKYLRFL